MNISQTAFDTLVCEQIEPSILLVRFNRPDASNALNTQMGREVFQVFHQLLLDAGEVRCVVLTGAGERAFCAGGDLKERHGMSDAAWLAQHVVFEQAFCAVMTCPIPVIAAVNGAAYGGGCEFALACDFIYAAATAKFALTETRLGIIPGGGGTQTLQRAVGARRAKELIFSAASFTAAQALDWGMVNRVVAPEALLGAACEAAAAIAANGPLAVRQAKRAVELGGQVGLAQALAFEIEAYNRAALSRDRVEGIAAFNDKRQPRFVGE